ncbi:MAG: carboxypeptidase regulatory-like domain-containing protein [Thermoanaerobaculum sp.]
MGIVTLFLTALAAAENAAPTHVVFVLPNGETVAREAGQVSDEDLKAAHHLWVWGPRVAARRASPERTFLTPAPSSPQLQVTVEPQEKEAGALRVVAAPVPMWEEVPEPLLPVYPVSGDGLARVPVDGRNPWRIRVYGGGLATGWETVPAGRTQAKVLLRPAKDTTFRVRGEGGRPMGEAVVRVFEGGRGTVLAFYEVRNGTATLPQLPVGLPTTLGFFGPEAAPVVVEGKVGALPTEVPLVTGAVLSGRVLAEGKPLAGAQVAVEYWAAPRLPFKLVRVAKTDAGGAFALRGLPLADVLVTVRAPGFAAFRQKLALASSVTELSAINLARGVDLPVVVKDDAAQPVSGARLEAGGAETVTDAQGQAMLQSLDAEGGVTLSVTAPGHLTHRMVLVPPWPERLEVTLQRAFVVRGIVAGPEGQAPAGGFVEVTVGTRSTLTELGAGGEFHLEIEPGQPVKLNLEPEGLLAQVLELPPGQPGELKDLGTVVCSEGAGVRFRLVDEGGQPVAGAQVWAPRPGPGGPLLAWLRKTLYQARSDSSGSVAMAGLPQGSLLLRVDAEGFARRYLAVEVSEKGWRDLGDVTLEVGREVLVRVEPPGAATEARLDLRGLWEDTDWLRERVEGGKARFAHVPAGEAVLTLWDGQSLAYQEKVKIAPGRKSLVLEVEVRHPRVRGTVTVGGVPASGGLLLWSPGVPRPQAVIANFGSPETLRQQHALGAGAPEISVPVGEDGTYETAKLASGSFEVRYSSPLGASSPPLAVTVPSEEEVSLPLAFAGFGVRGQVVDREGRGVRGARVRELATGLTVLSGTGGSFQMVGLNPPEAVLLAEGEGMRSSPRRVALAESGEPEVVTLVLEPREPKTVVVRVPGPEGGGSFVFVETDSGELRLTMADSSGSASFPFWQPEPRRVRAAALAGGQWRLGTWQEVEGEKPLVLEPPCPGVIRLASEGPIGRVSLVSQDGWRIHALAGMLGVVWPLDPAQTTEISGLPEGSYTLQVGDRQESVSVPCGKSTDVRVK